MTTTPAQRFASWLKPAMRRAGMDVDKQQGGGRAALADACQVSRSTVGRWLDGQSIPGSEHFEAIAAALGVPVMDLLLGTGIISAESLQTPQSATRHFSPEEAAEELGIRADDREFFLTFVEQLQKRADRA
ncbi:helix-turn-helix transcriptional regulator [Kitasatospora sp. NPDC048545]|uniref:helix-turn-helix domain-containing protein n=1 Tax=Kitasatospora sp. NPDC048545 TaxID=3157208 RepID=UPI0033F9506B